MHCSRVVREEHTQRSKPLDQFIERSLAGEIFGFSAETLQNFGGKIAVVFHSDNHPGTSDLLRDELHGFSKPLDRPAFRRSVFSAGADTQDKIGLGVIARCRQEAAQHRRSCLAMCKVPFSVVFGPRGLLFLGLVDYLSEQHRSEMPAKSHPPRNPGKPRLGRAAKRIGEEDRGLEASA